MTSLFHIDDLKRLREIVDARLRLLLLSPEGEKLALRVDTGEEIAILSRLTQKILAQSEIQTRALLPISDHAAIVALGFRPEIDIDPKSYSILIAKRGNLYRWSVLFHSATAKKADLYTYETSFDQWNDLEGSEHTLKTTADGIRTIGDLEIALHVATYFGRIDIRKELEYLDEQLDETDETPLSSEESDLSGTLKDFSSDPVVDVDDQISF